MSDPAVVLTQRLVAALGEVSADAAGTDPVVRPSDRADFQANGVMGLAKRLGTNPRELAQRVVDAVDLDGIASIEIAGPGFLNLTLDDDFLGRAIGELIGTDDLGLATAEDHQRVVIDYSAPNVAKEMHVGHLRSTVIGDALVRILEARGDTVIRQNHVGDWGTPFGMLIEHLIDLGEQGAIAELALGDLNEFYRQARVSFDGSEAFAGRARARVVALQAGDPETLRLWQILVDLSAEYFQSVYDRLGVRLTTDDLAGESIYNDLLSNVVTDLDEAGLLQTSGGARCVFPEGFTNREGEPLPLIVQKGDGGYGYATTDLAAIRYRIDELKADRILYVVGTTQAEHLAMVFTVAEAAGWLTDATEATHVAFGSVLGEDNKLMKSRSGESLKLSDLLDEAVARAAAIVEEKNPDLDDAERAEVARAVGIGAIKYADLSSDRTRDYTFSFDRMLAFEGNTAPYLQYVVARVRSILRKARAEGVAVPGENGAVLPGIVGVDEPAERALALALVAFERVVADTARSAQPHRLCTYLFELAQAFTRFYEAAPILKAATEAQRHDRLALAIGTERVMVRGLGLLGIDAPQRM
ncbi:arginine--tRNA ligase [Candidatus Microthrix sp.]|jgi:arginyl-tRNA synthetase|uniref:arginine--tRNA ligase n=1 Tax=Candidatus Neomicrothrix sp. TaxID=2719034 RepID=UPI002599DA2F|nr:arginine--tRNA ligase [Candidatus Microthrix sp.]HMS46468.1 arginine--tRNA ligase [Candidatus Microthrix sp.]